VQTWIRYATAVVISLAAVILVAAVQPYLGYLPLLFLAIVVFIHVSAGVGPSVVSITLCTIGSFALFFRQTEVSPAIHNLANLLTLPAIAGMLIYLLEGRRLQRRLSRQRLMELSILLESMPEAVLLFDRGGHVVDGNLVAQEMTGCSRRELLQMSLTELAQRFGAHHEGRPTAQEQTVVARALDGVVVRDEPRTFTDPSTHSETDVMVTASPMRDADGEVIGALVIARDVTEIRQLQHRMADAERHVAIGQMAAGIAHDFNNVLNTIGQAAALMEVRSPTGQQRQYLQIVQNAVRRGTEIILRVREYIRGGTGERRPVNLARVMEEALELTRPLWVSAQPIDVVRELGPVRDVYANATDLRRVFANLIINAVQAMPQGGRLVMHCEDRHDSVVAWVQDSGPGIPEAAQKQIFSPYFTTKPGGTGLGLSGAQKIVLALGGNISFHSESGRGTRFTVSLPADARGREKKTEARMDPEPRAA
jgi:PAS domain S-box-containing protein